MIKLDIKETKEGTNFNMTGDENIFPRGCRIFIHKDDYKKIDPEALRGILEVIIKFFKQ